MGRTVLIMFAVAALAIALRRISDVVVRHRRRRAQTAERRFQPTVRCARCGTHLAPGVGRETPDGRVCAAPECAAALADRRQS